MIERTLAAGPGRIARIRFTDRDDGDFHVDGPAEDLHANRRAVADGEWTWLRQVHGSTVVEVVRPGDRAGAEADGSVTAALGAVLAVQTADCAPIALVNDEAVGMAHAGWRGVVEGVIEATVETVRHHGDSPIRAVIGPLIRPGHYEFDEPELSAVADVAGDSARTVTLDGRPALDLAAAVAAALDRAGVYTIDDLGLDTSDPHYFSHRRRGERGRQCSTVCLEPA